MDAHTRDALERLTAIIPLAARLLQSAPDGAHGSRGSRAQPGQRVQRTQN